MRTESDFDQGSLASPVLFLIYNRPDCTSKVFEKIREARPRQLFVAADGPDPEKVNDAERCSKAREVIDGVDWPCEVKTFYRERNVGCGPCVSASIDWFFSMVEQGIILEDDCLPSSSFFHFCVNLLEYYRDNEVVMHISGDNFQGGKIRGDGSYYFSSYAHNWGWATWRRAWKRYDFRMSELDSLRKSSWLSGSPSDKAERDYWLSVFTKVKNGEINTWDYQWHYALRIHNGMAVIPNVNLVSNIGFSVDATHTTNPNDSNANLQSFELNQIIHPSVFAIDRDADRFTFETMINPVSSKGLFKRIFEKLSG